VESGRVIELAIDDRPPVDVPEPRVLFEDSSFLAIDKPAGLPTQGTLTTDRRSALGWAQRERGAAVRTVHRLDAGTSGVLVLAKTGAAATALAAQFREGTVEKRYLAICTGALPAAEGRLAKAIRPSARRGVFEVTSHGGAPAVTDYRVLAGKPPLLLVEARPATGRTHQIRVHLSAAGAPLLGDATMRASRPMLHAAEISLSHPVRGTRVRFEAAPPADFAEILSRIDVAASLAERGGG